MPENLSSLIGWIPAAVFPTATAIQLLRLIAARSVAGVSVLTWTLFGLANVSVYIYSEKYADPQSIIGFVLTAVLDFVIVALVLVRRPSRTASP